MNNYNKLYRFSKVAYSVKQSGQGFDYKMFLQQQEQVKSFWHDIPIYPNENNQNFVNIGIEIPKERIAKFEVSKVVEFNPIVQDTNINKFSKEKQLRYYAQFASYNYGFIPQTWENSIENLHEGLKGDDDPLDICELGIKNKLLPGDILEAIVLGAFCVADQGEVDWKIIVLNREEANQYKITNFSEYEALFPGKGKELLHRFKYIKTFDGKKENPILFDGKIFNSDKALEIIHETHQFWKDLKTSQKSSLAEKRNQFNIQ